MRPHSFALVALVIATLAGCSGASETPISAAIPSNSVPSITPTPTPTAEQALQLSGPYPADELLFVITATAHLEGGAVAELRQEVYAPVDNADVEPELTKQMTKHKCLYNVDELPPLTYVRAYASMTDVSPEGTSWPNDDYHTPQASISGSKEAWQQEVWHGATTAFNSNCEPQFLHAGSATGIGVILADSTPSEIGGWARERYGFLSPANGDSEAYIVITFEDCTITLGPAASELADKDTELFTTKNNYMNDDPKMEGDSCLFGDGGSS